jgi:gamma-glutamyltranspeptidase/glutathione hydrolase
MNAAPVRANNGMVVSTDAYASRVGVEILALGGNAVDAAVAVSFALAVVNPEAGNIGGGGFMVLRLADGTTAALDYRERAPLGASRDMYLDARGNLTDRSVKGHLAVGVPGTVAGLWEAHRRFGSLPWRDLVAPAISLAGGFQVRDRLSKSLAAYASALEEYPATASIFLARGGPPQVGEHLTQSDLARTLRRIREQGRDGFYLGATSDLIVAEMRRGGGIITHEDLASYQARWREPIRFTYRGYSLITMPPPSSGGATLAAMAKILEGYPLGSLGWHSPEHVHLLAEAWKRAYADRNALLGDPDFVAMPIQRMISAEYGAERRASIRMDRATPSEQVGPGQSAPKDDGNTTHFSVVDSKGNAVAVTTTINSLYGIHAVVPYAGFFLNNEMDDFAAKPGTANQFGLVQGELNAIAPGKRMLSAMTPTIVVDPKGKLFCVTGSPGGATIITNVFQNISNIIDFGMTITQAMNAPRLHHQHLPDRIDYEHASLSAETIRALEAMGHKLHDTYDPKELYPYIGDVQAIMVMPNGTLQGASDPRRGGTAIGY